MRSRSLLLGGAFALIVSGCAVTPPAVQPLAPEAWEAELADRWDIAAWQAAGRVATAVDGESYSGRVDWTQRSCGMSLSFRGPFGVGGFQLEGDGQSMRLRTSAGDDLLLEHPEQDLYQLVGWAVPLDQMRYWILGVPAPAPTFDVTLGEDGRPASIEQGGWRISFEGLREVDGLLLPRRVDATSGHAQLRFALEDWTRGGPDATAACG